MHTNTCAKLSQKLIYFARISMPKKNLDRREFLKRLGIGAGSAMVMMGLDPIQSLASPLLSKKSSKTDDASQNTMTYRVQHNSGEHISLLGFGMMRLPNDQAAVNELVDYAISHGVNYFDTAPMYMGGQSEVLTGEALSRYPRDKYYVAT